MSRCARSISFFVQPLADFRQVQILRGSDLVGETHHGEHQSIAGWLDSRDVLALAEHDGSNGDPAGIVQRITEQSIRFDAGLAVRLEIVRLIEVQIGDFTRRDEGADVERLSGRHSGLLEILIGHDNILALLVLIALHDFAPRNLDALLAAEPLVLDPGVVLLVQQIERQRLAALDGRIQVHRMVTRPKLMAPFQIGRGITKPP